MVVATAKLTSKFQITIPAEVRRRLGLTAGDALTMSVDGEQVTLRALKGGWTEASHGLGAEMWREAGGARAIEAERESWD
jgi:AbrB family looped-hinge helix DNA binding protein